MTDNSFLATSPNKSNTSIKEEKIKEEEKETGIIDLTHLGDSDSETDITEQDQDQNTERQIKDAEHLEALESVIDILLNYSIKDLKQSESEKGSFISEVLEILKKQPSISYDLLLIIKPEILRSVFPHTVLYNQIVNNLSIIETGRRSNKMLRNMYVSRRWMFVKCQYLFKTLDINSSNKRGMLNTLNSFIIGYRTGDVKMLIESLTFLVNIFRYSTVSYLRNIFKYITDTHFLPFILYVFSKFDSLLLKSGIISLLEVIAERFNRVLINDTNKYAIKERNVAHTEYMRSRYIRTVFKNRSFLRNGHLNTYRIEESSYGILFYLLSTLVGCEYLGDIIISSVVSNNLEDVYFSADLADSILEMFREEVVLCYREVVSNVDSESANSAERFLSTSINRDTNSIRDSIVESTGKSAELGDLLELSNLNNNRDRDTLSHATLLNTQERREVKKLRDRVLDSESEPGEIDTFNSLNSIYIDSNSINNKKKESISRFIEIIRSFNTITITRHTIPFLIKQIELFHELIHSSNNNSNDYNLIEDPRTSRKRLEMSPLFYENLLLKLKSIIRKRCSVSAIEYHLISVVYYYSIQSQIDSVSDLIGGVLDSGEFVRGAYGALDVFLRECQLVSSNSISLDSLSLENSEKECTFCSFRGFRTCRITHLLNMIIISLERDHRDTRYVHFSIRNIVLIYGVYSALKENKNRNNINKEEESDILRCCKTYLETLVKTISGDIFMFGRVFFDFSKDVSVRNQMKRLSENISKKDINNISREMEEDYLDDLLMEDFLADHTFKRDINIKKDSKKESESKENTDTIFKRLKQNVLDDD